MAAVASVAGSVGRVPPPARRAELRRRAANAVRALPGRRSLPTEPSAPRRRATAATGTAALLPPVAIVLQLYRSRRVLPTAQRAELRRREAEPTSG